VLPLSITNIAALFVILFIYGWNQYLWPLLIINERSLETIVVGLTKMIGTGDSQNEWNTLRTPERRLYESHPGCTPRAQPAPWWRRLRKRCSNGSD
jgi:hypothetical protein